MKLSYLKCQSSRKKSVPKYFKMKKGILSRRVLEHEKVTCGKLHSVLAGVAVLAAKSP